MIKQAIFEIEENNLSEEQKIEYVFETYLRPMSDYTLININELIDTGEVKNYFNNQNQQRFDSTHFGEIYKFNGGNDYKVYEHKKSKKLVVITSLKENVTIEFFRDLGEFYKIYLIYEKRHFTLKDVSEYFEIF